jgi:hypothetical protein
VGVRGRRGETTRTRRARARVRPVDVVDGGEEADGPSGLGPPQPVRPYLSKIFRRRVRGDDRARSSAVSRVRPCGHPAQRIDVGGARAVTFVSWSCISERRRAGRDLLLGADAGRAGACGEHGA